MLQANKASKPPAAMLTISATAKMLGVTGMTAMRMINRGLIPGYAYPGKRRTWRIARSDVERFMAKCRTGPPVNDA